MKIYKNIEESPNQIIRDTLMLANQYHEANFKILSRYFDLTNQPQPFRQPYRIIRVTQERAYVGNEQVPSERISMYWAHRIGNLNYGYDYTHLCDGSAHYALSFETSFDLVQGKEIRHTHGGIHVYRGPCADHREDKDHRIEYWNHGFDHVISQSGFSNAIMRIEDTLRQSRVENFAQSCIEEFFEKVSGSYGYKIKVDNGSQATTHSG